MLKLTFTLILTLAIAASMAADPIDGMWSGATGAPQDRVEIALEFKTSAGGEIEAKLYQPVVNFYGLPMPAKRDGDGYRIDGLGATLTLAADKLEGTIAGGKLPISLSRTDKLPAEVPVPDLPRGPSPSWQTHLGGMVYSPVAVRDGVAYIGTTSGVMNAVFVKDGELKWTFSAGKPIYGGALVTNDAVFFVCDSGMLYRLDRTDGKEVWHYDLGDALVARVLPHPYVYDWDNKSPQPVLAGNIIYAGSGDGSFHAVNAATGKRVWRFEGKEKNRTDALIAGDRVVFGSLDGAIYALSRETGKQLWRADTKAPVTSTPVLVDGKIVVGNRGSVIVALNPADGAVVWRAMFWGSWVESAAVPYGDRFYIGASDLRRVTCYDPKDGRVVWRTDVYGWTWGNPAVTDRLVYAGVAGGTPYFIRHVPSLTALDRATGKIVWRWLPPESPAFQSGFPAGPVIEGKMLVIGAMDGTLYGFPIG